MRLTVFRIFSTTGALIGLTALLALILINTKAPTAGEAKDVFGLESLMRVPLPPMPPLVRYEARDGIKLPYRIYPSTSPNVLIFVHGSTYHGGGYHLLGQAISRSNGATVVLPNLRGHYRSGEISGDVNYIGQLEDDISDLINVLSDQGYPGPYFLGGHSSGGGFAIRFGSGPHSQMVQNYLLLAPAIPGSPTFRPAIKSHATAHKKRLLGLFTFNFFGIHAFDHLKVITFNKPLHLQDRTETLSYSHRLNLSYHPRFPLGRDLNSLPQGSLMLIGGDDEVINADDLITFFEEHASLTRVESLPHINHIWVANSNLVFSKILEWCRGLN